MTRLVQERNGRVERGAVDLAQADAVAKGVAEADERVERVRGRLPLPFLEGKPHGGGFAYAVVPWRILHPMTVVPPPRLPVDGTSADLLARVDPEFDPAFILEELDRRLARLDDEGADSGVLLGCRAHQRDMRIVDVEFSIRKGGGHGVLGSAVVDGGLCIDLRGLDYVEVSPETPE